MPVTAMSSLQSTLGVATKGPLKNASLPLVSIIIPFRNQLRWLEPCLQSCFEQTYPNLEWILVDDASEEDPQPVIDRLRQPVKVIRLEKQVGPGAARNEGLGVAQGLIIQFLDADDFIHPRKIEVQVKAMLAAEVPVVLSGWKRVDCLFGLKLSHARAPMTPVGELLTETIADTPNCFPVMSGLYKKSFLETVGPWRADLSWNEDREYRYRMLKMRPEITTTPDCFFYYRREVLKPSRSTALFHQPGGIAAAVRLDCAYLQSLIADTLSGEVGRHEAQRGVWLRLFDLKEIVARSHPKNTAEIQALVTPVEKRAVEAGLLTEKEYSELARQTYRAKTSLRALVSNYVKPRINKRLWKTLNLIRNAVSMWVVSWAKHGLAWWVR